MQIWCIKTDWASYDETGSDVTLYAAREQAQADFEKEDSNNDNASKDKKTEAPEKKPSFYSMVELALNEALGRKISITKNKGRDGGVLQIEFYSDEELTELSNKLK